MQDIYTKLRTTYNLIVMKKKIHIYIHAISKDVFNMFLKEVLYDSCYWVVEKNNLVGICLVPFLLSYQGTRVRGQGTGRRSFDQNCVTINQILY